MAAPIENRGGDEAGAFNEEEVDCEPWRFNGAFVEGMKLEAEAGAFNEDAAYSEIVAILDTVANPVNQQDRPKRLRANPNPPNQQASANSSAVTDSSATADPTAVAANPAKVRRLTQQQSWQHSKDSPGGQSLDNQTRQLRPWDNWTLSRLLSLGKPVCIERRKMLRMLERLERVRLSAQWRQERVQESAERQCDNEQTQDVSEFSL